MTFGAAMGYGGIRTISDANVRNCKSDIGELRPTLMYAHTGTKRTFYTIYAHAYCDT